MRSNLRNIISAEKAPAAGQKTSTKLSHGKKSQEHRFILVLDKEEAAYFISPENKGFSCMSYGGMNCVRRENENESFAEMKTLACKIHVNDIIYMKTSGNPTDILPQVIYP